MSSLAGNERVALIHRTLKRLIAVATEGEAHIACTADTADVRHTDIQRVNVEVEGAEVLVLVHMTTLA